METNDKLYDYIWLYFDKVTTDFLKGDDNDDHIFCHLMQIQFFNTYRLASYKYPVAMINLSHDYDSPDTYDDITYDLYVNKNPNSKIVNMDCIESGSTRGYNLNMHKGENPFYLIRGILENLINDIKNYCKEIVFEENQYSPIYWNYIKNTEKQYHQELKDGKNDDYLTAALSIAFEMLLESDYKGLEVFNNLSYRAIYNEQRIVFPKVLTSKHDWDRHQPIKHILVTNM